MARSARPRGRGSRSWRSPPMEVGFHFAEGYVQRVGNLLITGVLEMKEHERHALMVRQRSNRMFQPFVPFGVLHRERLRDLRCQAILEGCARVGVGVHLAEE